MKLSKLEEKVERKGESQMNKERGVSVEGEGRERMKERERSWDRGVGLY